MIRTYLTTALRHLGKYKLYAGINIIGLALGLSACMLIGIFIFHELRYDKFHTNADRLVRATMEFQRAGTINEAATTGTKVGPQLKRSFPAVESYIRCFMAGAMVKSGEQVFEEDRILYADPDFFKAFTFPMIEGNAALALNAPEQIVITRSTAQKYFGTTQAINKALTIRGKDYIVSAVCEDAPMHSQIKFDFVTQFLNYGSNVQEEQWWTANWTTYLLLHKKEDVAKLEQQVSEYMQTKEVREAAGLEGNDFLRFKFQPIADVHLHSSLAGFEPNGDIKYLYIFGAIGLLILLIASANYTNLATAQSVHRSAEIGMRKTMGASRRQVFLQFIGEAAAITTLSALVALALALLCIPWFNQITGKNFSTEDVLHPLPLSVLATLTVVISLLAGAYPAIVIAGAQTIQALKKGWQPSSGKHRLRKTLIVIQFGISVFLMVYTGIIMKQMQYLQQKNLGYNKDQLLILPVDGKMNYSQVRDALANTQGVQAVTASYETPEFVEWGDGITATDEKGVHEVSLNAMPVDLNFIQTLQMKLAAGRDFNTADLSLLDTSNQNEHYVQPYVINESLAKKIGWTAEESIGKTLQGNYAGPVVGVVKDFHFESLHEPVKPMLMFLQPAFARCFIVRLDAAETQATINRLEVLWKQRVPHRPFTYHFLDEDYNKLYQAEQRIGKLFTVSAAMAIMLACLGLFGLAAFTVVQRTKEIGIRRVLGASTSAIILLVSSNFLLLVGAAILLAIPLAWYAGHQWLMDFAYRIDVPYQTFIIASVAALIIAFVTISLQSLKAAMANPTKNLRSE